MFDLKYTVVNFFEELKLNLRLALTNKSFMFTIITILILFIILTFYLYGSFIKPNIQKTHQLNREFIDTSQEYNENDVLMVLFRTQWCPHCKTSEVEWNKFKDYIDRTNNGNTKYQVILTQVDCDKNPVLADKYNIEGYPTVKLFYKGTTYHYDAKVLKDQLIEFLESSID